tara:strand:- start:313 stop:735 length:423 start_codon:yes stop_codon:yes gene_type:complete
MLSQEAIHKLLEDYEKALAKCAEQDKEKGRLEMEIYKAIDERGGTALPNANENGEQIWVCERDETYTYDQERFQPLLEKFNTTELNACYIPPHDEPVAGKWVTAKVKSVANKHGDGAEEIVAGAKQLKGIRLKFQRILAA